MPEEPYKLIRWKQYRLVDNGLYAPEGSNPKFHTEAGVFESGMNPLGAHAQGYVMHDMMAGDDLVPKKRVWLCDILDKDKPQWAIKD